MKFRRTLKSKTARVQAEGVGQSLGVHQRRNEYGRYGGHAEGRDPFGSSDWGEPLPA